MTLALVAHIGGRQAPQVAVDGFEECFVRIRVAAAPAPDQEGDFTGVGILAMFVHPDHSIDAISLLDAGFFRPV